MVVILFPIMAGLKNKENKKTGVGKWVLMLTSQPQGSSFVEEEQVRVFSTKGWVLTCVREFDILESYLGKLNLCRERMYGQLLNHLVVFAFDLNFALFKTWRHSNKTGNRVIAMRLKNLLSLSVFHSPSLMQNVWATS